MVLKGKAGRPHARRIAEPRAYANRIPGSTVEPRDPRTQRGNAKTYTEEIMRNGIFLLIVMLVVGCSPIYYVGIDMRIQGETDLKTWMILSEGSTKYEYEVFPVQDTIGNAGRAIVFICDGQHGNFSSVESIPTSSKIFMADWLTDPLRINGERAVIVKELW